MSQKPKPWLRQEADTLEDLYADTKDLSIIAKTMGKSRLQILRKLTSLGIYEKPQRNPTAKNKDMLARDISSILGIRLFTLGNMSREELLKLLEHLERNVHD